MPKGAQKVYFSFDETHIIHFGGMWLIQRFCKKLGLKKHLQNYIRLARRNQDYHPSELILALIFVIIMGLRRINKTEILKYNGAFLEMLGLARFPDQSTLRRFLKRLPPKTIRRLVRLHDSLRAHLFCLPAGRTTLIFDIDSVVITIYGKQEGAQIGYNPKRHGRRSYHPLLCFESHFQEFWHGSLRPGNVASYTGVVPFIKACLKKVPSTIARSRIRFRMDSGYYGSPMIKFLKTTGCGYVIAAKQYPNIKRRARTYRFHSIGHGWEAGEFRESVYWRWKKKHRFVVVRHPILESPEEIKQPELFKDKEHVYYIFVTNLKLSPWRVYLFYRPRAAVEKNVRELLYTTPWARFPQTVGYPTWPSFKFFSLPQISFIGSKGYAYQKSISLQPWRPFARTFW